MIGRERTQDSTILTKKKKKTTHKPSQKHSYKAQLSKIQDTNLHFLINQTQSSQF
jgi:hypothetical protein